MNRICLATGIALCAALLVAPAIALAGEEGTPFWVSNRAVASLQHTPWNDVHVVVSGASFDCGLGATNSATLLDEHVGGPGKDAMHSMLLAALLAGRDVDIEVVRHVTTTATHCGIRRVQFN